MKQSKRNKKIMRKHQLKEKQMNTPGFKSKYARKKSYLFTHGGWGFEHEEKHWK